MSVGISIKRYLEKYPTYLIEEVPLMRVRKLEVTRNEEISDRKGHPAAVNYIAVIEECQLSDKFILIDLENVEKRDKKYKRCGFSTKRKIERTDCGSEAMDERKKIKSRRFK